MLKYFSEHVLHNPGEGLFSEAFKKYQRYIDEHESDLPHSILKLVRSNWYFNATDHQCPKDAWVIKKAITNDFDVVTRTKVPAEFEITLLGAYHNCHVKFLYQSVIEIDVAGNGGSLLDKAYDSWRIDEFSVDDDGIVTHSIYFMSGKIWTIKFRDFEFNAEFF